MSSPVALETHLFGLLVPNRLSYPYGPEAKDQEERRQGVGRGRAYKPSTKIWGNGVTEV